MDDMISIVEAADMLGASRATVLRWASNGTITGAVQVGSQRKWFIPRSAVVRIHADREKRSEISRQDPGQWVPMTEREGRHV